MCKKKSGWLLIEWLLVHGSSSDPSGVIVSLGLLTPMPLNFKQKGPSGHFIVRFRALPVGVVKLGGRPSQKTMEPVGR